MCGKDAACEKATAMSRDSLPQSCHLVFPRCAVRKRDNRQQTNNISLIYDLLTVFLRNRTKGPETQIEDKAARLKKISNLSATNKGHWLQRQGNNSRKLWSLKIWEGFNVAANINCDQHIFISIWRYFSISINVGQYFSISINIWQYFSIYQETLILGGGYAPNQKINYSLNTIVYIILFTE